jgi:hypoxanthine phosphoribosyltransferase
MSVVRQVPPHYREAYSAADVKAAVGRLAAQLTPWALEIAARSGEQVLGLCVLRGAFVFFSDLVKAIPASIQPAFIQCRSYATTEILQPEDGVQIGLDDFDCQGRHVLLVDDICDSGRTLALVQSRLRARLAAEVRTCVLIHRQRPDSVFTPDLVGFQHDGPEWFVGYGMDDRHRYMNYPAVYVIDPLSSP